MFDPDKLFEAILAGSAIFILVQLNVQYWRRRREISPEQKRQEDEELWP